MSLAFLIPVLTLLIGGWSVSLSCVVMEDYGTEGEVFPIKEVDIREVMLKEWKAEMEKWRKEYKKKIEEYHEKDAGFSYATGYKEYTCTPKYTLPEEVRDKDGKVIYPKGYTFNPLDYMSFPFEICFITEKEVDYLPKIDKSKKTFTPRELWQGRVYVLVKGNSWKLREKGYIVWDYGLSKEWIERMCVREVPACVRQVGNQFLIKTGVRSLSGR